MPEPLMAPPPAPGRVNRREELRRGILLGMTPRAAVVWIGIAAVVVATGFAAGIPRLGWIAEAARR